MPDTPKATELNRGVCKRLSLAAHEKEVRDGVKYGPSELMRISGIGKGQISDILRGKSKMPSFWAIWQLCEALGVRIEWVATGRGDRWQPANHAASERRLSVVPASR